jgi:hypothetical protein
MSSKISKIRSAWAAGDRIGALRIAAGFFDRPADTKSFKRGMALIIILSFIARLGRTLSKY